MTADTPLRVLVLGGTGFIGKALVRALAAEPGVEVAWTARPQTEASDIAGIAPPVPMEDIDALDLEILRGQDVIINLISRGRGRLVNSRDVMVRVRGHSRLIDELINREFRGRFVYLSSGGTVYGIDPGEPCHEDMPLAPFNDYGLEKAMVEMHLGAAARTGMKVSMLRVANAYGEGQVMKPGFGVIPAMIGALKAGQPFKVYGTGESERDYVHVDDIVSAILLAMRSNGVGPVNIGAGRGTSVRELLALCAELSGTPMPVETVPVFAPEPKSIVLDIARARERLGWTPSVHLKDGIVRLLAAEGLLRQAHRLML
ncbi:NAD-dependent epimerase/dehydratase family protein (plasmid) [Acuticoccus sp. MNP-M23]|uniref:NAD-dependent epimerase/dehydratase family protein n=1 Tax=Acuticoccus sp. MNP-M23 TaxID=3072793 RepID=UPI0028167DBD|nr:NAD-dependent epimerase/dehydratase family protein [Acuticoccus sp. MNP-M23]WMS45348.1 NAD-dependent epimerase/dehydratase family protein [Acuticoccus sp. MNP-M23]